MISDLYSLLGVDVSVVRFEMLNASYPSHTARDDLLEALEAVVMEKAKVLHDCHIHRTHGESSTVANLE